MVSKSHTHTLLHHGTAQRIEKNGMYKITAVAVAANNDKSFVTASTLHPYIYFLRECRADQADITILIFFMLLPIIVFVDFLRPLVP